MSNPALSFTSPSLLASNHPARESGAQLRPAPAAARALPALRADGSVSLLGVPSLDAQVLSILVRGHGRAAAEGRRLRLVGATPAVRADLEALGLGWLAPAA